MPQFDVHRYASKMSDAPYVVDLQNELLDDLGSRLVAPLYPVEQTSRLIRRLHPVFKVEGRDHYLAIQEMAAINSKWLKERVTSLTLQRSEILAAIDFLLTGV